MTTPRVGDNVWVEGHKQPNGVINHIDWYDKEIIVVFHDGEWDALEWDDFIYFNERLNQWILEV